MRNPRAVPDKDLLRKVEDLDVEYKITHKKIGAADLAAFANSLNGGTILIGVDDVTHDLFDTELTDEVKTALEGKAAECRPSLRIHMRQIALDDTRLIRIDIPPSPDRPHGSAAGTYKIRVDSASRGIRPHELLEMFELREVERFAQRFEAAVEKTTERFEAAAKAIADQLTEVSEMVERAEQAASSADSSASSASYMVEDLESLIKKIPGIDPLQDELNAQFARLERLVAAHNADLGPEPDEKVADQSEEE